MKYIVLYFVCLFSCFVYGQTNSSQTEKYYVFDKDWKGTTVDKAVYLVYVQKKNDTAWQSSYYNYSGPLLWIETYRNEGSEILHGYHAYFDNAGKIDSNGYYLNGKRNGDWLFYDDSLNTQKVVTYSNGLVVKEWNRPKDDTVRNDPADPNEKEAEFKNGIEGWKKYLSKNLTYTTRAENNNVHGTVMVKFIVDKEGKVTDPYIIKSVEFSLDQELIRVLHESPNWKPGFQFGKNVNSYHTQPVTF